MKNYKTKEEAKKETRDRIRKWVNGWEVKYGIDGGEHHGKGWIVDVDELLCQVSISQVWDSAFEAGRKEPKNTTKT